MYPHQRNWWRYDKRSLVFVALTSIAIHFLILIGVTLLVVTLLPADPPLLKPIVNGLLFALLSQVLLNVIIPFVGDRWPKPQRVRDEWHEAYQAQLDEYEDRKKDRQENND